MLDRYEVAAPERVSVTCARHARRPRRSHETSKPGDALLGASATVLVTAADALAAAAAAAESRGVRPVVLGDAIEGEARDVGLRHAGHALDLVRWSEPGTASELLSGGETTVTVSGAGRGGRTPSTCSAWRRSRGCPDAFALGADTDGRDGSEGTPARSSPDTLARARAAGLDPRALLADNDAYALSPASTTCSSPGPTLTNVNDLRAILVAPLRGSRSRWRTLQSPNGCASDSSRVAPTTDITRFVSGESSSPEPDGPVKRGDR